jgi:hypothetical protein
MIIMLCVCVCVCACVHFGFHVSSFVSADRILKILASMLCHWKRGNCCKFYCLKFANICVGRDVNGIYFKLMK